MLNQWNKKSDFIFFLLHCVIQQNSSCMNECKQGFDSNINLLNELYSSHDISYDTSNEYESAFGLLWLLNHSDIFMLLTTAFRLFPFFSATYQGIKKIWLQFQKMSTTYLIHYIFFSKNCPEIQKIFFRKIL